MNLDSLFEWIVGIVLAFALTGHLGTLQRWIWREQAKIIYASRASAWPTPRIWPDTTVNQRSKAPQRTAKNNN